MSEMQVFLFKARSIVSEKNAVSAPLGNKVLEWGWITFLEWGWSPDRQGSEICMEMQANALKSKPDSLLCVLFIRHRKKSSFSKNFTEGQKALMLNIWVTLSFKFPLFPVLVCRSRPTRSAFCVQMHFCLSVFNCVYVCCVVFGHCTAAPWLCWAFRLPDWR